MVQTLNTVHRFRHLPSTVKLPFQSSLQKSSKYVRMQFYKTTFQVTIHIRNTFKCVLTDCKVLKLPSNSTNTASDNLTRQMSFNLLRGTTFVKQTKNVQRELALQYNKFVIQFLARDYEKKFPAGKIMSPSPIGSGDIIFLSRELFFIVPGKKLYN